MARALRAAPRAIAIDMAPQSDQTELALAVRLLEWTPPWVRLRSSDPELAFTELVCIDEAGARGVTRGDAQAPGGGAEEPFPESLRRSAPLLRFLRPAVGASATFSMALFGAVTQLQEWLPVLNAIALRIALAAACAGCGLVFGANAFYRRHQTAYLHAVHGPARRLRLLRKVAKHVHPKLNGWIACVLGVLFTAGAVAYGARLLLRSPRPVSFAMKQPVRLAQLARAGLLHYRARPPQNDAGFGVLEITFNTDRLRPAASWDCWEFLRAGGATASSLAIAFPGVEQVFALADSAPDLEPSAWKGTDGSVLRDASLPQTAEIRHRRFQTSKPFPMAERPPVLRVKYDTASSEVRLGSFPDDLVASVGFSLTTRCRRPDPVRAAISLLGAPEVSFQAGKVEP